MGFDIEGARKEGYSDAEIADHLASQRKFDLAGARKEGYTDAEIISHLAAAKPAAPTAEPAPAPQPAAAVPNKTPAPTRQMPQKIVDSTTGGEGAYVDPMGGVYSPDFAPVGATLLSPYVGAAKAPAAIAQYFGFNKPAELLQDLSRFGAEQTAVEGRTRAGTPTRTSVTGTGELAGELAGPVSLKAAQLVEQGLKQGSKYLPKFMTSPTVAGVAHGSTQSAITPVDTKDKSYTDFLIDKANQIGLGGLLGGPTSKATQMLMAPKVSPELQKLKDMGMEYFTPGQLLSDIPYVGKALRGMEAKSTSLPLAGGAIEKGLQDVAGQFNIGVANKVLKPLNLQVPTVVAAGEPLMGYVLKRVDDAYSGLEGKFNMHNILDPKKNIDTYHEVYSKARREAQTRGLGADGAKAIDTELKDAGFNVLLKNGSMSGKEFRLAESNLGSRANLLTKSADASTRELGFSLFKAQEELRKQLAKQNPAVAEELKGIHQAFRMSLPFRRAGSMLGAENRIFSPQQLESAVKSKGGEKAFISGRAPLYEESQLGKEVLGNKVPSSGTTERALSAASLATLPLHWQASLPATAAAYSLYSQPAMKAMTKLATERPEVIKKAAKPTMGALSRTAGALSAGE
jgi:hypothetical protein